MLVSVKIPLVTEGWGRVSPYTARPPPAGSLTQTAECFLQHCSGAEGSGALPLVWPSLRSACDLRAAARCLAALGEHSLLWGCVSTACLWVPCSSGRPGWCSCETLGEGLWGLCSSLRSEQDSPVPWLHRGGFESCHPTSPSVQLPAPPCSETCASGHSGCQSIASGPGVVRPWASPVRNQPLLLLSFFLSLEMGSKRPIPRD